MIVFCTSCQRDLYVAAGDELACPVCSSPLVEIFAASGTFAHAPAAVAAEKEPVILDQPVPDILDVWVENHRKRGGDFCPHALAAGLEVAALAEEAGWGRAEAFEAGRAAYFEQIRIHA